VRKTSISASWLAFWLVVALLLIFLFFSISTIYKRTRLKVTTQAQSGFSTCVVSTNE